MKRIPILSVAAAILALAPVSYVVYGISYKSHRKVSPQKPQISSYQAKQQNIDDEAQINQAHAMHEQTLRVLENEHHATLVQHKSKPKPASTSAPAKPKDMKVGHLQPTHQVHHAAAPPPALARPITTGPKISLAPVKPPVTNTRKPASTAKNTTTNTTSTTSASSTNHTSQATSGNQAANGNQTSPPPSPPPSAPPQPALPAIPGLSVFGYVIGSTSSLNDAEAHAVNVIAADTFSLNSDGSISGYDLSGVQSSGRLSYAVIADFGTAINSVLGNSTATNHLTQNLVSLAVTHHYAGINLDLEMISSSKEKQLNSFVANLETQLHSNGKLLSMAVPAESGSEYWYDAYNYAFLGQHVDQLALMTYDYSYSGSTPGAIAPLWWVTNVVKYALRNVPAHKILLGIAAYGYDWTNNQPPGKARGLSDIERQIQSSHISPTWDAGDSVPYYTYQDSGGQTHTVYYEDETSIADKLALAKQYGLGGISIWRMGLEDPTFWQAVNPYASGH